MKTCKDSPLRKLARKAEREAIQAAIKKHGSIALAARVLDTTSQTIRNKLKA